MGLNIQVGAHGKCKECNSQKDDDYLSKNNSLPIWYNEKEEVQYKELNQLATGANSDPKGCLIGLVCRALAYPVTCESRILTGKAFSQCICVTT